MGKFKFRLQSFLGVKEKMEEQKKIEYGRALQKLEEEKQRLQDFEREKASYINLCRETIENNISPSEFRTYSDYIELLKKKMRAQVKVIEQTAEIVERRRLELVDAMKERKMLDTLKERDYEQFLKDELMAEQKLVDEIVSYRYHS